MWTTPRPLSPPIRTRRSWSMGRNMSRSCMNPQSEEHWSDGFFFSFFLLCCDRFFSFDFCVIVWFYTKGFWVGGIYIEYFFDEGLKHPWQMSFHHISLTYRFFSSPKLCFGSDKHKVCFWLFFPVRYSESWHNFFRFIQRQQQKAGLSLRQLEVFPICVYL